MTIDPQQQLNDLRLETAVQLGAPAGGTGRAHLFDHDSILAIRAALAARRPLLVRGEPGCGKTQLAAAAARILQRPLISFVVDSRTEAADLLWRYDSLRRLAEAQLCGALRLEESAVKHRLKVPRFITPGPLWLGFDWNNAVQHCQDHELAPPQPQPERDPANGRVVLIDEIDKGDSDVPNGLLEALGAGEFTPEGCPTVCASEPAPLVIITTNEERALPDAFIRRCLVLRMEFPAGEDAQQFLVQRATAHFGDHLDDTVLRDAAQMLLSDRKADVLPKPGLAEYLDLLRAVLELQSKGLGTHAELLGSVRKFTLHKHLGLAR